MSFIIRDTELTPIVDYATLKFIKYNVKPLGHTETSILLIAFF